MSKLNDLGIPFGQSGIIWDQLLPSICKKMSRALNVMRPLALALNWSPKVRLMGAKTIMISHVQFGAGILWAGLQGMGETMIGWKELQQTYIKTICFVLDMPLNDSTPTCGLDILYSLTGLPSFPRLLEEFGARLQYHFSTVFHGCPIKYIQNHPPPPGYPGQLEF